MLAFLFCGEFALTHLLLSSFLSWEFLLHIPCWLSFSVGSFSYTSHAGFVYIWGVCLTHPELSSFYLGIFSYTSHADFVFMWGVSLTHPVLCWFLGKEILLYFPCCLLQLFFFLFSFFFFFLENFSYTCRTGSFSLSGEFLLYIPCWLYFYHGSFSYTYRTSWGVSLTHPMMTLCLCGFSYTSHAGFLLCGEFLLHIPIWLLFLSLAHTVVAFVFYVKSFFPLQSTLKTVH